MVNLAIPARFLEIIAQNNKLKSAVETSISNFQAWINDNKLVFFPEYTDHGTNHLQEVLDSAQGLISEGSWDAISPEDIAAIVLSVLLHDCALHLSEDGFYELINSDYPSISSRYIEQQESWSILWSNFLEEARRFDDNRLISLFGKKIVIRDIPNDKGDLTLNHRLLIGEFLRRHHARLAHEIAFNGIPNGKKSSEKIKLATSINERFIDLVGFIAKSHNLSLRSAVDKLGKNSKQSDQGVHVPFVMSILRIADYIQIHSERAPTDLLNIKKLMSPISRGEWNKHHAIDQIHQNHDDPEAIFVDAEPTDAITYESLERLFSDIQKELDLSWSILGEVYGRYKNLNLGLNIRRIRSSLDNKKDFIKEKKIKYIPEVFRFRTAHTKLMELLIKPLYGNHPEIGIRELLQNSVDAIKERVDLEKKHSDFIKEDLKINLILVKERNHYYFVIKDNGVGMTKEIIRDYFLNIGASFRYSDIWKNQHINNGKTNFSRIGRFGVGVLAAYLLGEKIYVETRNMFEDYGLSFSCESVHSPIQLERINMDVGTIIKIEIDELTYNYLFNKHSLWDWYLLSDVVIERSYNEDGEIGVFNKIFEVDVSQFHQLETKSSCEVKFSFMSFFDIYRNEKNILTCNGVNIKDSEYSSDFVINKNEDFIILKKPSLLVEDKEGIFPLDLQRQRVVENPDFTDDLRKTLYERIVINAKAGSFEEIKYIRGANCNNYIYGENRKYLFDLSILKVLKVKKLCYFVTHEKDLDFSSLVYRKICKNDFLITSFNIESTKTVNVEFLRSVFLKDNSSYYNLFFGSIGRFSNKIILIMKKTHIADYVSKGNYPPTYWERLFKVNIDENWTIICNKPISIDTIDINLDFILPYLIEHKCRYFLSYDFNWDDVEIEVSDFAKVYQKTYPDFNLQ